MKKPLRQWLLNLLVLWLLAGLFPSISYSSATDLIWASIFLLGLQLLVLPVITILFTPISLISFGSLSWVPVIIIFGIFSWLDLGYKIHSIIIPRLAYNTFSTPVIHLGTFGSIVFFAILYGFLTRLIYWVLK